MNAIKHRYTVGFLCGTLVAGFSCAALADDATNAPAPKLESKGNPNDYWGLQVTGDYFRFKADYTTTQAGLEDFQQTGNLYGVTMSIKMPFMKPDDAFDLSYRYGSLSGVKPSYPVADPSIVFPVADRTIMAQYDGLYRLPLGFISQKGEDPHFKVDALLGFDVQEWNSTEIQDIHHYWIENGSKTLLQHQLMGLFDLGLGANWYFWTVNSSDASTRFRIGLRGEALFGIGAASITDHPNNYPSDNFAAVALSGSGKGCLYTDYKFGGGWTAVLEAGWQYTEYWLVGDYINTSDNTAVTQTQALFGPYVRLGVGYSF